METFVNERHVRHRNVAPHRLSKKGFIVIWGRPGVRNGGAAHASCPGSFGKDFAPVCVRPACEASGHAVHGAGAGRPFSAAGRHGDEKVYTLSSPRSAGRAFSVKISLKSCAEGRMCYNFFNKKPHRSLMKTRILSRYGAGPAGAALYGAPSGSGNMHTAGRRRFRTVFPPAAAGPDASRRESRVFSFRFSARFVAMLYMEMYNYKISQRDHSVCDGATAAETFL